MVSPAFSPDPTGTPPPSPRDLQCCLKVRQVRHRAPPRYTKCACGRTLTDHRSQTMAASRKRPMVPGAGCARMCTRRRPVCCVCSGTVCSIVLGCPFRFYCRAAHSAANGDRSGATTAPTLCLAAPLAAARPTRIQRPRRRHRRDAARYDHSRPRPASLPLSSATLPATPLSGSTAARPVRSGGGRRSVMRCGCEGREDCGPRR